MEQLIAQVRFWFWNSNWNSRVVYIGTNTTENLTNLSSASTYHFAIYEFKDECKVYRSSDELTGV